jgi:prepilin-type N-terminal cleavage/methylation domain-containing protein
MARTSRLGFTLIETILVVALLSLLIALMVPNIARVRDKGREIKMSSVVRSHAAILTQYAGDYHEMFPYLTDPLATKCVIRSELLDIAMTCKYLDAAYFWHIGLADGYYSGSLPRDLFGGRNPRVRSVLTSTMIYPLSFIARPEYWNLSTRTEEPLQFAPTTQSDVSFPALKALVTEAMQNVEPNTVVVGPCVGFVDGHGEPVARSRSLREGPWPLDTGHRYQTYSGFWFFEARFIATTDGTHGRDIR